MPLVGDFHYIGHKLLADHPACAEALDKYRINPGNVGFKDKKDRQFATIVEMAIRYDKAVRIGVNWGSLDQELLTHLMDENADSRRAARRPRRDARGDGAVGAALGRARRGDRPAARPHHPLGQGLAPCRISSPSTACWRSARDYALHLGLTEAGMGSKGIVASSAAIGILLQEGIGDTIRVSLTPEPGGDRTLEVKVAQELLQTMGFRTFVPLVAACPGCGRTTSTVFQELARDIQSWIRDVDAGVEDDAIPASRRSTSRSWAASSTAPANPSTPTSASRCPAPAKRRPPRSSSTARKAARCAAPTIAADFKAMVIDYIEKRYGGGSQGAGEHGDRGGIGRRIARMERSEIAGLFL